MNLDSPNPSAPCMEYLPTKLGDFVRANVDNFYKNIRYMEHLGNDL